VEDISCIGVTNQRETLIVFDKETGKPLYNAIAWPDTRTAAFVRELKQRDGADELQDICGLPLSTYPSSVKLLWLFNNVEEVKKKYDEGKIAFATVDTWLIWNLTGGKEGGRFVTDVTNASRTMFMNLEKREYDSKLLKFFNLDQKKIALPEIVPSADKEAYGALSSGALKGIKITGCLGDQSAALVGQQGFSPGAAKNTYGTGCFLLYNVGEKPVISKHGLLATIAYQFGRDSPAVYALEGSIAVAGSGVKFLVNNMGISSDSEEVTKIAGEVPDNGGCVFVTAFSGLFAPYWIDDAQGTIFGITAHVSVSFVSSWSSSSEGLVLYCASRLRDFAECGGLPVAICLAPKTPDKAVMDAWLVPRSTLLVPTPYSVRVLIKTSDRHKRATLLERPWKQPVSRPRLSSMPWRRIANKS
jgi:glycerol kinase